MNLTPGMRISSYEIIDILGAGAMGAVYRARDTSLGREVAIKVLPEEFAEDEERLARFDREARLLAQLNHSGIAGIHGVEATDSGRYIVMEFVPGGTLTERLAEGPMPLPDALNIAGQMADALEAAHESGIVHRDLKPDNVAVTPDDSPKLLDFGIGKPVGEEAERIAGTSSGVTQTGAILGTPAYISPEQLRGKPVDRRADIWGFGCLLYEMLTGARAFSGETIGEIAAAVLTGEPDWAALPPGTPEPLRRVLQDCLARDPRDRMRDISEARRTIERLRAGDGASSAIGAPAPASASASPVPTTTSSRWHVPITVGVAAVAIAITVWAMRGSGKGPVSEGRSPDLSREVRFEIELPEGQEFVNLDVSHDGSTIALILADAETGNHKAWIRRVHETTLYALPATSGMAVIASFGLSPTGAEFAFTKGTFLRVCATDPGTNKSRSLTSQAEPRGALDWGPNGQILYLDHNEGPLQRVEAAGGTPQIEVALDAVADACAYRDPTWLGDGPDFFAFVRYDVPKDKATPIPLPKLWLFRGADGTAREVVRSDSTGWLVDGWLLHRAGQVLQYQRFDSQTGELSGEPATLAGSVRYAAASPAGTIAYHDGYPPEVSRSLLWFDPAKGLDPNAVGHPTIGGNTGDYYDASPSPKGHRVAVTVIDPESDTLDLWILGGTVGPQRLTEREGGHTAVWSPDGKRIAYSVTESGDDVTSLFWRMADGTGTRHRLAPGHGVFGWSDDGNWLCYKPGEDVGLLHFVWVGSVIDGRAPPHEDARLRVMDTGEIVTTARFSPDGKWICYSIETDGEHAIFVRPFDPEDGDWGDRHLVAHVPSTDDPLPSWSPTVDGGAYHLIFQRGRGTCMRVRLKPKDPRGAAWEQSIKPEVLFSARQYSWNHGFAYSHDGKRILVTRRERPNPNPVTVIVGWKPPTK